MTNSIQAQAFFAGYPWSVIDRLTGRREEFRDKRLRAFGGDLRLPVICCAVFLAGCVVTPKPLAAELAPLASPSPVYRLGANVTVRTDMAESQVLRAGTAWRRIGDIPQGAVYHTTDQVVIVNSFSVFEADIVVSGGEVVGFFIPVGRRYVAARPAAISFKEESN